MQTLLYRHLDVWYSLTLLHRGSAWGAEREVIRPWPHGQSLRSSWAWGFSPRAPLISLVNVGSGL